MKTIYRTFDARDFDLGSESIELEISYAISRYRPATWNDLAEGGEIEDAKIKTVPESLLAEIDSDEFRELVEEWVWDDYDNCKDDGSWR
jgi:hypothetical protein